MDIREAKTKSITGLKTRHSKSKDNTQVQVKAGIAGAIRDIRPPHTVAQLYRTDHYSCNQAGGRRQHPAVWPVPHDLPKLLTLCGLVGRSTQEGCGILAGNIVG